MTRRWRVRPADRPAGRQVPPKGADEVPPRSGASVVFVSAGDSFAPRRERFLCLRRPHFFQQRKKWGKERRQKLRFCTSSARYTALVCKAAPPRNRHFLTRCRSPDCASTAFRCRCLLLRQKLFVLPCRRLRNNYILCPTGTPTFAAARRQRRDLIIAKNDQRTRPYPRCCQRQRRKRYKRSLNRQCYPLHFMRECIPPNLHLPAPRQGTLRP